MVSALQLELAKCLQLVVPASMTTDDRAAWLAAAADALEGIRADEVMAVSAELRRSVTRPSQIVPEVAKLVSDRRRRLVNASKPVDEGRRREAEINREAAERRGKASTAEEINDAAEWERQARVDAGLSVPPRPKPLSRKELDELPGNLVALGIKNGFLERRDGKLFETV